MSKPYTVVGWWDTDGGGDYVGHVEAANPEDAKTAARLAEQSQQREEYFHDLVIIAVFDGHLTEAK